MLYPVAVAAGGSGAGGGGGGRPGGLSVHIGSVHGTDREAARRFSRCVADELRRQGVIG
jgi:hypothetical protein